MDYKRHKQKHFYVLIPEEFGGGYLMEDNYDGYGVFGGRDIYALVAQWNCPEKCKDANGEWLPDKDARGLGIDIACYDEQNAAPRSWKTKRSNTRTQRHP